VGMAMAMELLLMCLRASCECSFLWESRVLLRTGTTYVLTQGFGVVIGLDGNWGLAITMTKAKQKTTRQASPIIPAARTLRC